MLEIKNKTALVIGYGISGKAAAEVLVEFGAKKVIISDSKQEENFSDTAKAELNELRALGVELSLGQQSAKLLTDIDFIIISPAVPKAIPLVQKAEELGIPVLSEVELAYHLAKAPIIAITGTNGKTTTTSLIGEIVKTRYTTAGVGGNIGIPLSKVALTVPADSYLVAEISSYQMECSTVFRPHIAVMLNLTPDHLVRHGSMEVYQAMKEKLFQNCTPSDFVVLNYDDPVIRAMSSHTQAKVLYFSQTDEVEGAYIEQNAITINDNGRKIKILDIAKLQIKGRHNVENALAATLASYLAGVPAEAIAKALGEFQGVEHRIEFVRKLDGVAYYNDSKATNTDSAIKALEAFEENIILIAGGDDKLTDLTDFMALVKAKCKGLILIGDAAARFNEVAINAGVRNIYLMDYSMPEALTKAREISAAGDVVLLSPACASFDMYSGFEERGRDFKKLVMELV